MEIKREKDAYIVRVGSPLTEQAGIELREFIEHIHSTRVKHKVLYDLRGTRFVDKKWLREIMAYNRAHKDTLGLCLERVALVVDVPVTRFIIKGFLTIAGLPVKCPVFAKYGDGVNYVLS